MSKFLKRHCYFGLKMSSNIVKGFSKFRCIRWLNKISKAVNYYRPHIWNIPQFLFKKKNQLLCWWMRARGILGLLIILILKTIQVIRGSVGTDKSALFHSYRFTGRFCWPLGLVRSTKMVIAHEQDNGRLPDHNDRV